MNKLSMDKKVAVVTALVEGCSVRSTSRLTGVAKGTILRILDEVGTACAAFQDAVIRNVKAERVQVDEIWSFVGCKQKNVTVEKMERALCGDAWTFAAIEAQSKLVISWLVGRRDAGCATEFLQDVASRLANRVQLTTDGHKMYLNAVVDAFCGRYRLRPVGQGIWQRSRRAKALQPGTMSWHQKGSIDWFSRPGAHQHVLYRASEPHHADERAAVHSAYQCVLQKDREPHALRSAVLHALQFRADSSDFAGYSGDGCWCYSYAVVYL